MSPDGWSEDHDVARWEALEAEARERQHGDPEDVIHGPEGPGSSSEAESSSWWDQPPGGGPSGDSTATDGSGLIEAGTTRDAEGDPEQDGVAADILLADADYAIGASLERAMTDRGWIVRRVDNGELALAEFLRLPPDCFVFDYSLPGLGGLDLLRKLAEFGLADRTRLVVNSVQTQTIHVQRARALGAHRFLDRPLRSPDQVVEAVAEQLDQLDLDGAAPSDPGQSASAADPESAPAATASDATAGGLFAPSSSLPPAPPPGAAEEPAEQPDPPPPSPAERRSYRSAFGRGGGPPGRVPRLG